MNPRPLLPFRSVLYASITLFLFLMAEGPASAIGGMESLSPDPRCKLEVSLRNRGEVGSPELIVRNVSSVKLDLLNISNRRALTIILFDESGNQVEPVKMGKIDPKYDVFSLEPQSERVFPLDRLQFVTGSALVGFELIGGRNYSVMAVYRPYGKGGPSYSSQEIELKSR